MEEIQRIEELLASLKEESTKFYKEGNKAAGTRARKAALLLKEQAQSLRVDILLHQKGIA